MPKKILVVDDEADARSVVRSRLEAAGYECLEAQDGLEGLAKARQEQPDLVILDLMLPKMDGYKVCSALKADERYEKIPVLLFTAKAGEEARRIGLEECGAEGYLTKPFDGVSLLSKVRELLKEGEERG